MLYLPWVRFYMSDTKWLTHACVDTIHATTRIPRYKLHPTEFLSQVFLLHLVSATISRLFAICTAVGALEL